MIRGSPRLNSASQPVCDASAKGMDWKTTTSQVLLEVFGARAGSSDSSRAHFQLSSDQDT